MSNPAIRRYQCRHIFTDGRRCGSPSLRDQDFCYYHNNTRRPKPELEQKDPYNYPPNQTKLTLPIPEDRSAVQLSIGQIIQGLAENTLDPRRAGLMLYALQIASMNLKNAPRLSPNDVVDNVTLDPTDGALAPKNELPSDVSQRAWMEVLGWNEEEDEDEEDFDDEEEDDEDEDDEEEDDDSENESGGLSLSASAAPATRRHTPRPRRRLRYPRRKCCVRHTLQKSTRGEGGYPASDEQITAAEKYSACQSGCPHAQPTPHPGPSAAPTTPATPPPAAHPPHTRWPAPQA